MSSPPLSQPMNGSASRKSSGSISARKPVRYDDNIGALEAEETQRRASTSSATRPSVPAPNGVLNGFAKPMAALGSAVEDDYDTNGLATTTGNGAAPAQNAHADLNDVQLHYLTKALVSFEISNEWTSLSQLGGLTKYGIPFSSSIGASPSISRSISRKASHKSSSSSGPSPFSIPSAPTAATEGTIEPFLFRGLFRNHILTFPGFNTAPAKYYTGRAQPWFDGLARLGLSSTAERGEPTKRMQLNMLLTRLIGAWYTRGIRMDGKGTLGQDSAARPGQKEMDAINAIFPPANGSSAQGWYVGVAPVEGSTDSFIVGSQKKGQGFVFAKKTLAAVENLSMELESMGASDETSSALPRFTRTPYSANSLAVHIQLYLRTLLATIPSLPSTSPIPGQVEAFLSSVSAGEGVSAEEGTAAQQAFEKQDKALGPFHRAWVASGKKVDELNEAWRSWVHEITEDEKGLDNTWSKLSTAQYTDLPTRERLCVEKAGVWVAYFLYDLFVTGPNARESLAGVRWLLSLIPWWPLRQLLRVADPSKMVSMLISFILARPFGLQSLFVRLASAILGSHAQKCRKDAAVLEGKLAGEKGAKEGAEAIRAYVDKTTAEERERMVGLSATEGKSIVECILATYSPSGEKASGVSAESLSQATLAQLQTLLSLLSTARDYDSLLAFCGGPEFVKIVKDTLAVVLYHPLTAWGKSCKLSDRVHDLQIFLTELVEVARKKDVDIAAFLALCAKHQQRLYYLFSEAYTRGGTLTDPLREWCRLGLTYMRTSSLTVRAPSSPSSSPTISLSAASLISSLSPEQQAQVRSEVDGLAKWTRWTKMRWHIEMRRNVLLQQGAGVAAAKVDVDECVRFVAGLMGEDVGSTGEVEGTGVGTTKRKKMSVLSDTFAWAWYCTPSVLSTIDRTSASSASGYHRAGPRRPDVSSIRKYLLVPFLEQIRPVVQEADERTLADVRRSAQGK